MKEYKVFGSRYGRKYVHYCDLKITANNEIDAKNKYLEEVGYLYDVYRIEELNS